MTKWGPQNDSNATLCVALFGSPPAAAEKSIRLKRPGM